MPNRNQNDHPRPHPAAAAAAEIPYRNFPLPGRQQYVSPHPSSSGNISIKARASDDNIHYTQSPSSNESGSNTTAATGSSSSKGATSSYSSNTSASISPDVSHIPSKSPTPSRSSRSSSSASPSYFDSLLIDSNMPEPGLAYFNARRALWLDSPPVPPTPASPSPSRIKLEALLNQPGAVESEEVWKAGLKNVWKGLVGGNQLRKRLPLSIVLKILQAGWLRDGTWPQGAVAPSWDEPMTADISQHPLNPSMPTSMSGQQGYNQGYQGYGPGYNNYNQYGPSEYSTYTSRIPQAYSTSSSDRQQAPGPGQSSGYGRGSGVGRVVGGQGREGFYHYYPGPSPSPGPRPHAIGTGNVGEGRREYVYEHGVHADGDDDDDDDEEEEEGMGEEGQDGLRGRVGLEQEGLEGRVGDGRHEGG